MTEAIVIGRVGVDLTPPMPRTSLAEAKTFVRSVGGFAGNIATGLARLGVRTAVISAVGDDGHGDHVRASLQAEGVDVRSLATRAGAHTQVAFFEVWPPEHFPVTFYRHAPAPETELTITDLSAAAIAEAPLVIISGTLLAEGSSRSMTLRILEERRSSRGQRPPSWTILDLDWRPTLWPEPSEAAALMASAVGLADVVLGSDVEFAAIDLQPALASQAGPGLTVLKHGPDGVSLLTGDRRVDLPGLAVEVLCGIGAGDALAAAFGAGLVRRLAPEAALERGNAAGAIVASRLMCSTAMPTASEIDHFLRERTARAPEVPS